MQGNIFLLSQNRFICFSRIMSVTEILLFVSLICVSVYFWLKHNYSYWRRNGIPYIKPTPFLGNITPMFTLKRNIGLHLSDIYNDKSVTGSPVVGIYLLHKPALIIRDTEILKSILIKDFNKFSNRYSSCDPHHDVLGALNAFFVKNPAWRQIRLKLTPAFTSGKIKQMYPLMQEIGNELETHLASYEKQGNAFVTEVKDLCGYFITDMISVIAFGVRVNSLRNPKAEFRQQVAKLFEFNLSRALDFFVIFFLPGLVSLTRSKIFPKDFTKFLRSTIDHVMSERKHSGVVRNDLIDILLALQKESTFGETNMNDYVAAQAAAFLAAGFETSSSTMTFALYELAKRQDLQQRLREEINTALVEGDGSVSYEKIQSMEYLGMIVDETLRMYPTLPFLDREYSIGDDKAYTLKPHYDYELPNGMPIYIPIFGLHRDPKHWPDPNTFDPERFTADNKKLQNPMAYMPFGNGPHNCIGSRIGLLNSKMGLVRFLKNHYVTTCDRTVKSMEFESKALVLQCKGGVYLNIVCDGLYDNSQKLYVNKI